MESAPTVVTIYPKMLRIGTGDPSPTKVYWCKSNNYAITMPSFAVHYELRIKKVFSVLFRLIFTKATQT